MIERNQINYVFLLVISFAMLCCTPSSAQSSATVNDSVYMYSFVDQWVKNGPVDSMKYNLNLDMIARSDGNEIFASGIVHYPDFMYTINEVQTKTNVKLLRGDLSR